MAIDTQTKKWTKGHHGLPYPFKGDSYNSPGPSMYNFFSVTHLKDREELIVMPIFPENRGISHIVKYEDGFRTIISERPSDGIVLVDSGLTLLISDGMESPGAVMQAYFNEGGVVSVEGPNSLLDKFSFKEIVDSHERNRLNVLTRKVFDEYFSGEEGYSFEKIQDWIADSRYGLPDTHRNAVRGLLEI